MKHAAVLAVALVGALAAPARAQDRGFATLTNDNDYWALRGTDRDYSNGLELDLRFPITPWWGLRRVLIGAAVGQAFFTPPDLKQTDPIALQLDRPYAGWTWAAARLEGFTRAARVGIETRAGVVGPHALGEQTQIAWHAWNGAPRPMGWSVSQIRDKPDVSLGAWVSVDVMRHRLAAVTTEGACEVGTIRIACKAGVVARLGLLREDRAAVPRLDTPMAPPFRESRGTRPAELFVFAGLAARVVARDELLEGDLRSANGVPIPAWAERRSTGGEIQIGVAGTWRGWSLGIAEIVRSSETRLPIAADRTQRFGRIVLGYAW